MTFEEAIQELEWIYQNGFENDIKIIGTDRILDAIRMGIEAIEIQIPKKPTMKIVEKRIIKGCMYPHCPVCNTIPVPHPNVSYCDYCGQAIDWSDE